MKIAWIAWWMVNAFWLALFVIGCIFLIQRDVDATGAIQTPPVIMLSILALAMAFVIPLLFQLGWMMLMIVIKRNRNNDKNEQPFKE